MLAPAPPPLSDVDLATCQQMIREGSKSFYAASLLLPKKIRLAATALYAFCRLSDDMVDEGDDRRAAIEDLKRRLELAYAGRPFDHPADRAFSGIVHAYEIPRTVPEALIEGYEWDVDGRDYETIEDVIAYSTRVAATVGVMMTLIMGRREPHVLARAADLGVAMQLTNIARDVGEDARNGRIYLPQQWLRDEGVTPDAFLSDPRFSPALGRVVQRFLKEADVLYYRGFTGLGDLPASCQPAICAAGLIYRDIGKVVARNGFDSVTQRAFTSKKRKVALCAKAMILPTWLYIADRRPALDETAFLVNAACEMRQPNTMIGRALDKRMTQLIRLFEALEERDRYRTESH